MCGSVERNRKRRGYFRKREYVHGLDISLHVVVNVATDETCFSHSTIAEQKNLEKEVIVLGHGAVGKASSQIDI